MVLMHTFWSVAVFPCDIRGFEVVCMLRGSEVQYYIPKYLTSCNKPQLPNFSLSLVNIP